MLRTRITTHCLSVHVTLILLYSTVYIVSIHTKDKPHRIGQLSQNYSYKRQILQYHTYESEQMTRALSEALENPDHPPSLIRVFSVRTRKPDYPQGAQRRLWSAWASTRADLSLRWARKSFCCFHRALVQTIILKATFDKENVQS